MSILYVICGPNGAGKTTASFNILPEILNCNEFVNADEIARGLSPFNPEKVAISAGKLMLSRMNELLNAQKTFAFETTLATKSYIRFIHEAKNKGYQVFVLFLALESPELAINRVKIRVSEGGHNVFEKTIRRRFKSGLKHFFEVYKDLANNWIFVDNSKSEMEVIAQQYNDDLNILLPDKWSLYKKLSND